MATEISVLSKLTEVDKESEKALQGYKELHADWNTFPNDKYVTFYEDWVQKRFVQQDKIVRDDCAIDTSKCDMARINYLFNEKQFLIANLTKVNALAKKDKSMGPEEFRTYLDQENRKEYMHHCRPSNSGICDRVSERDKKAVDHEVLKDEKINPLEEELKKLKPGSPEYLALQLKIADEKLALFKTRDEVVCKDRPADLLLCRQGVKEYEDEISFDKCFAERTKQVYDVIKPDEVNKHLPASEASKQAWAKLPEPKDCKQLMEADHAALLKSPDKKPDVAAPAVTDSGELIEDKYKKGGYKTDSCEWVKDLPRKIVAGPGGKDCHNDGKGEVRANICIGYVACQHDNGGIFIRMSTCSPANCGADKAKDCTMQKKYHSVKGKGEQHETISGEIREAVLEKIKK